MRINQHRRPNKRKRKCGALIKARVDSAVKQKFTRLARKKHECEAVLVRRAIAIYLAGHDGTR